MTINQRLMKLKKEELISLFNSQLGKYKYWCMADNIDDGEDGEKICTGSEKDKICHICKKISRPVKKGVKE